MHKVIVEEPRHGGGRTKYARRKALPLELLPTKEGMRRPHIHRKWFGEHLGPLKRWLRSKVGQSWNNIYSEASAVIKPNDMVRLHIRTHMLDYVKRHTFMRGGEVWYSGRAHCWGGYEAPVSSLESSTCRPEFYVHPQTGILHEAPQWKKQSRSANRERFDSVLKWVKKDLALVKVNGAWFACAMRPLAQAQEIPPFDWVMKLRIADVHGYEIYGRWVYCESKRQLSRRELKKFKLSNAASPRAIFDVLEPSLIRRIQGSNGVSSQKHFSGHIFVF
jgi:hypothetical protein